MTDEIYSQWFRLKLEYPGNLVLMRLGDFVETFDEDAQSIAGIFQLTARKANGHVMAGFPYAAVEQHLQALIQEGYKIAFCEQVVPQVVPNGAKPKRIVTQASLFEEAQP